MGPSHTHLHSNLLVSVDTCLSIFGLAIQSFVRFVMYHVHILSLPIFTSLNCL